MSEKRYTIFHPFFMAFYSKALYRDVARNWTGTCYFYLFILLAICWLPTIYKFNQQVDQFIQGDLPVLLEEMPRVEIVDGDLSIDQPMPYVIEDDQDRPVIVIDTTGSIENIEQAGSDILVTKEQVIAKRNQTETRVYDIPDDFNAVIDRSLVHYWTDKITSWAVVLTYPFLLIGSYLYRIVQTLIYASFGALFFAGHSKVKLLYPAILRISVIAITPAIIISTIIDYCDYNLPYSLIIYFAISILYLFYGINANKITDTEPAQDTSNTPS